MPVYSPLLVDVECPDLSNDEQDIARLLGERIRLERGLLSELDLYYDGQQRAANLGISTPPVMDKLHTVTGWPRLIVDSLDERLDVEGFRYPDSTTADDDLWSIWQANNLDEEAQLAHLDALVYGRAFVFVGSPDKPGDPPLITVESPVNAAVRWDVRTRAVTAALQVWEMDAVQAATILLPDVTIQLEMEEGKAWQVVARNPHDFGVVPVAMIANRQRTTNRYGVSEITPEIRSLTDAGCRTLLGLEAAREFYAVPIRYALGVTEEAFKDAKGNQKNAWDAAMSKVWMLPRDDQGEVPQVGQFNPMSPAVYTGIIDKLAQLVSSLTGLPPHFLGLTTQNPASADAIRSAESRLDKRALRKQQAFSGGWEAAMRFALMFANGGTLPDEAHRIETIWRSPSTPTIATTTQAVVAQVTAGIIPPESDVTLEELGYTPVQRARLRADSAKAAGEMFLNQIAHSLEAKDARVDKSLAADISSGANVPGLPKVTTPAAPAAPPSNGNGG